MSRDPMSGGSGRVRLPARPRCTVPLILLAALLALTGCTARAAAGAPAGTASPLEAAADALVANGGVGYSARVDDGGRVVTITAGLADRATGRRLGVDDQFEIGSITKTFLATVALQLVAEHALRLEDGVERWLPGVVPNGAGITVRMLLQHTSGIYSYDQDHDWRSALAADPARVQTPQEQLRTAFAHAPLFAPGTSWAYSNTNYVLVGMVLQKVTGRPPADLVARRITGPLGLHDTYLATDRIAHPGQGVVHGYLLQPEDGYLGYVDTSAWSMSWIGAAGAMISTNSDVARFYSALLAGKLLPREQLTQMETTVPVPDGGGTLRYGLGLIRRDGPCGTTWGHGGETLGHHALAQFSADGRRGAVADVNVRLRGDLDRSQLPAALATALDDVELHAVCQMNRRPVPPSGPARAP